MVRPRSPGLTSRCRRSGAGWAGAIVLFTLWAAPETAHAQTGNFCVRDFQPGAVCTANDVRIQALNLISIVENGDGVPDLNGGPWLAGDADACGDIAAGTQLFKVVSSLRVACVDTNGNGTV